MKPVIKKKRNQKNRTAFSLVELLVVIGIIALLVGLSMPAINAMQKSFDSTGSEGMISTALSTARTLAISRGQYAGVRFQKVYDDKGPLEANQYMIFIVYAGHDVTNWDCGFIAIEGYKPIKLPSNTGVIDKIIWRAHTSRNCGSTITENQLASTDLADIVNITDTSTFSVIFSPAGKLVIHNIGCRNNDYKAGESSKDDVFNTKSNVESAQIGMFIEDYNTDNIGLGVENSRTKFVIYDREKFEKMTTGSQRMDYLNGLEPIYVNPYTGALIEK